MHTTADALLVMFLQSLGAAGDAGRHAASPEKMCGVMTGVKTKRDEGGLRVRWAWQSQGGLFIVGGLLGVSIPLIITISMIDTDRGAWLGVLPLAVVCYVALAKAVNKTTVEVTPAEVTIGYGPLPWKGKIVVSIDSVNHVIVLPWKGRRGSVTYNVIASVFSGRPLYLFNGVPSEREAESLAVEVRKELKRLRGPRTEADGEE